MGGPIELETSSRRQLENPFGQSYTSFQDAYDDSPHDGFGTREVTVVFCAQAGKNVAKVAQHLDIDADTMHAVRAPASAALPGVRQDLVETLGGEVDILLGHPNCGGAALLDGDGHPDKRATRTLKVLASDLKAEYAGLVPFETELSNVLYVVSDRVADFDPSRVPTLPTGYTLHEHLGRRTSTLETNVQALLGVIRGNLPNTKTNIVSVTNGQKGSSQEFAKKLRTITDGSTNVTISSLVVGRR